MASTAAQEMDPWLVLSQEVPAVLVPDGLRTTLAAGTEVTLVHELGGDFTVKTRRGATYRFAGEYGDVLGRRQRPRAEPILASIPVEVTEEMVRDKLRTVYDPEIPVNLVDLGLIYAIKIGPPEEGGQDVQITMTLTAPGCGMSQYMVDDILNKTQSLSGVRSAEVEVVFDPPWVPEMMSEAARLEAGLY